MKRLFIPILAALAFATGVPAVSNAQQQAGAGEAKLRDALKNTLLQLRDMQNQLAVLQSQEADSEQKAKDLQAQLDNATKQAAADKESADKTIAALKAKSEEQDRLIAAYKEAQEKWKAGYQLAASAAKTNEAERVKLASEKILLQRRVDDLETKNVTLYETGNEILERYEKFSLGQALAAKEPFIGLTKVKLENQVQGYQDKLSAGKIIPNKQL